MTVKFRADDFDPSKVDGKDVVIEDGTAEGGAFQFVGGVRPPEKPKTDANQTKEADHGDGAQETRSEGETAPGENT